jgi:hypothetical protein
MPHSQTLSDHQYTIECETAANQEERVNISRKRELVKQLKTFQATKDKYLGAALSEMMNHHKGIQNTLQRQYDAMHNLVDYIDRMRTEISDAESLLEETNKDQEALFKEMLQVEKEINSLLL